MADNIKKAEISHEILQRYMGLRDYATKEIDNILREYGIHSFDEDVLRGLLDSRDRTTNYLLCKDNELRR